MEWKVKVKKKLIKKIENFPIKVSQSVQFLILELQSRGPILGNWPNFGKLKEGVYHCHLIKGRPTYVAVWKVLDKEIRTIEVTYVGTHEKAPY